MSVWCQLKQKWANIDQFLVVEADNTDASDYAHLPINMNPFIIELFSFIQGSK